jgi:hypothetical protein
MLNERWDTIHLDKEKREDYKVRAYLSKLGFYNDVHHEADAVAPANGLKYIAIVKKFEQINVAVVEIADIDTIAKNTNLPTLIYGNPRYVDGKEITEITAKLALQRIFDGFSFVEAKMTINDYYEMKIQSYAKYVEDIKNAYNRIFRPYRVEYNLKTKQFQVK